MVILRSNHSARIERDRRASLLRVDGLVTDKPAAVDPVSCGVIVAFRAAAAHLVVSFHRHVSRALGEGLTRKRVLIDCWGNVRVLRRRQARM